MEGVLPDADDAELAREDIGAVQGVARDNDSSFCQMSNRQPGGLGV